MRRNAAIRIPLHFVKHIVYFTLNEHLKFDWDDDKLADNIEAHKIHFETAKFAWQDPLRLFREDDSESNISGEDRYQTLGKVGKILFVVYTERGDDDDIIRLISARTATSNEKKAYHGKSSKHAKNWRPANEGNVTGG
jgi:uncharacterized DUF497 family protein